jgi:hypothetical protein
MFGTALTGSGSSTVAILYRGAGQAPNHGSTGFFSSHFIFYLEIRNGSMLQCCYSIFEEEPEPLGAMLNTA